MPDEQRRRGLGDEGHDAGVGAGVAPLIEHVVKAVAGCERVLWADKEYIFGQFESTPYLAITSPEKRSGKSRLLEVLQRLTARPWFTVLPSEAVVFRKIQKDAPTLLLDDLDAIYGKKAREHEGLRAILNAGSRRGTTVPRCVPPNFDVKDFPVYCPKALAGIGELPDTVADRSIPIRLARKKKTEKIRRFRWREADAAAAPIIASLEAWGASTDLSEARPEIPEELNDRAADGWEGLLAIADAAGVDWPEAARDAAKHLHTEITEDDETIGVRLLSDIKVLFSERSLAVLFTEELIPALNAIEEAPWSSLRDGKGMSAHILGGILKQYQIKSKSVRRGDENRKGYKREWFEDTWERYLPPSSGL